MKRFIFLLTCCLCLGGRAGAQQPLALVADPAWIEGVVGVPDTGGKLSIAKASEGLIPRLLIESVHVCFNPVGEGARIRIPVDPRKAFFRSGLEEGRFVAYYRIQLLFADSFADPSPPVVEDTPRGPRLRYDPRKFRFNTVEMGPLVVLNRDLSPIVRIPLVSRSVAYPDPKLHKVLTGEETQRLFLVPKSGQ